MILEVVKISVIVLGFETVLLIIPTVIYAVMWRRKIKKDIDFIDEKESETE